MSCSIVFAVFGLTIELQEVGCGETYYLGSSVGDACDFGPVCDRGHVKETGRAVEQNGLNNVQKHLMTRSPDQTILLYKGHKLKKNRANRCLLKQ